MARAMTFPTRPTSTGRYVQTVVACLSPLAALLLADRLLGDAERWVRMWLLAIGVFAMLKGLTLAAPWERSSVSTSRWLGYLFLWPGMDAPTFLDTRRRAAPPARGEWLAAFSKTIAGFGLVALAVWGVESRPEWAAWACLVGLVLGLHCGLFHVLSIAWRHGGVEAAPLMRSPLLSASLAEFWGARWNRAFRDLAHRFVFRPLVGRVGGPLALLAVFGFSGLAHDVVISLPAGGGWGWPTAYFALQGVGLVLERSTVGRAVGLGRGWLGRLFCGVVVSAPLGWLAHRAFIEQVIWPMLRWLGE